MADPRFKLHFVLFDYASPIEVELAHDERIVNVEQLKSGYRQVWIANDRYRDYETARDAVESECRGGCSD